jgi:hypothetical protein
VTDIKILFIRAGSTAILCGSRWPAPPRVGDHVMLRVGPDWQPKMFAVTRVEWESDGCSCDVVVREEAEE